MTERPKGQRTKGGRINQRPPADLGVEPGKKAAVPDPEKLLTDFQGLTRKDVPEFSNPPRWVHKRSRRRRH